MLFFYLIYCPFPAFLSFLFCFLFAFISLRSAFFCLRSAFFFCFRWSFFCFFSIFFCFRSSRFCSFLSFLFFFCSSFLTARFLQHSSNFVTKALHTLRSLRNFGFRIVLVAFSRLHVPFFAATFSPKRQHLSTSLSLSEKQNTNLFKNLS